MIAAAPLTAGHLAHMLAPLACAALRSALGGARSLSAFAQVHAEPCSDSWELPRPGIKRAAQPWHAPLPGDHQLSSSGPAAAAAAAAPRAGHRFPTATATEHVTEFHSVLSLYRCGRVDSWAVGHKGRAGRGALSQAP